MRESTGTLNTFRIVIVFTLLFASFITLAITYNKVIKLKNESLSIIERREGITVDSVEIMNRYLKSSGYHGRGVCKDGEYGMKNLDDDYFEKVSAGSNDMYFYCVSLSTHKDSNNNVKMLYKLRLFYSFELSLFDGFNLFTFEINGETKSITKYNDVTYIEMDEM